MSLLDILRDENIFQRLWVLRVAGIENKNIGNYDDVWFDEDKNGAIIVKVQTQNGGGHHSCLHEPKCDPELDNPDDFCCACIMTNAHSLFVNYIDHEYVSFHANFINMMFSVIPKFEEDVLSLVDEYPEILNQYTDYEEYREKFIDILEKKKKI